MLNPQSVDSRRIDRRSVLAAGALGATAMITNNNWAATPDSKTTAAGTAEHCIFIWLGGGAGQIDTWDPKQKGDPQQRKPGSYYESIDCAVPGVRLCEHFRRCAPLMDRFALVRSVHHDVIDEHAAAVNRMHTGRPSDGTITYPSIGSIVAHEFDDGELDIPPYVVVGYPNLTRGPGFLGARHGYLYLTDTEAGPAALQRSAQISSERQARRERLLGTLRSRFASTNEDERRIADYDATIARSFRLSGPRFMSVFDLKNEAAGVRESYGGEFGQRCLLARRLVERNVRFVEVAHNLNFVNGTGWDVHNEGIRNQHVLIQELDQALSALVRDLETRRLLDKTLIVVSTEFGRPAKFDGRGGRGHWSGAFSVALAGGGLKLGQVVGATDHEAQKIVSDPVSVPDLFATIFASLGIDPQKQLSCGRSSRADHRYGAAHSSLVLMMKTREAEDGPSEDQSNSRSTAAACSSSTSVVCGS